MERPRPALTGITIALVGFGSSFAVVLAGLQAAGASAEQAASGLIALCLAQALGMLYLAHRYRRPLTLAWSTPGAALLVGGEGVNGGWAAAVGAFGVVGALLLLTALWPAMGRATAAIPAPVAQAMLAGVLFSLCLAPVEALVAEPLRVVPLTVLWIVLQRWWPVFSAPAVFAAALVLIAVELPGSSEAQPVQLLPRLELTTPEFSAAAIIGLGLPLYLVTMASQNVPGAAVISSYGHSVPWRASLTVTGLGTIAGSAAGGHAVNLAAITAALGAAEEAHRDPGQRWRATASAGWTYLVLALCASALTFLATQARPGLLETVAGLALLGTLAGSLRAATQVPQARVPATATFLVAASGISAFGIGAAFWALVTGLVLWWILVSRGALTEAG